jgi:hypothetical protein
MMGIGLGPRRSTFFSVLNSPQSCCNPFPFPLGEVNQKVGVIIMSPLLQNENRESETAAIDSEMEIVIRNGDGEEAGDGEEYGDREGDGDGEVYGDMEDGDGVG